MAKKKKLLILTGGGDCPGLNTVIRAIVKSAYHTQKWEVLGSIRAYHGILKTPQEIIKLTPQRVAGIHVLGGTILETTNKGNPFNFPVKNKNNGYDIIDRSDELIAKIKELDIDCVISLGGDGSQRISEALYRKGLNIIGVPKTIDNDLSSTDFTFGFQTAVQTATEAVDKLVTTAQSHSRIMITEVMGRDAGWICLNTAIAAGAEIALIPEIPYNLDIVMQSIESRFKGDHGFVNIVIAEGAKAQGEQVESHQSSEVGYENPILGGVGYRLMGEIKQRLPHGIRVTVLGHTQRGGTPIAFDRILATQFGVKAFELAEEQKYGNLVSLHKGKFIAIPLKEAVAKNKYISKDDYLINTAQKIGICLGI